MKFDLFFCFVLFLVVATIIEMNRSNMKLNRILITF